MQHFRMAWQKQNNMDMRCPDPSGLSKWKAIWHKLVKMDEHELYEETGCMAKCKRKEWTMSKIFDNKLERNNSKIFVSMFYANGRYREGKQYFTYDFNSYVSDFGGYLGLLLGYSMVSFFDMAHGVLSYFVRKGENQVKVID